MSSFFTKRNIIIGLVVLILALSIPLSIRLVQQQTQLKSKATAGEEVIFRGPISPNPCNPQSQTCTALDRNIQIEVRSPF